MDFNPSPNYAEIARWCRNIGSAMSLAAPVVPVLNAIPHAGPALAAGVFIIGSLAKDVLEYLTANKLDTQGPK